MSGENLYLSLSSIGGALMEQRITDKILACNQDTAVYGLVLTQEQCRFVKDVLQIKEKRKGPVKGRASLKDGWENGCKPVHGRLAEL